MNLDEDRALLQTLVDREGLDDDLRARFEDMADKLEKSSRPLTDAQRAFAESQRDGVRYDAPVVYENLVSSGRCPRGKEVELLVRDKPLRPPGRRA